MTSRERLLRHIRREPIDRVMLWPETFWNETAARWTREGMPAGYNFGYDFDDGYARTCLGVNIGFCPPFEPLVLDDEGEHLVVRDEYGVTKRVLKSGSGMPQFISFPVHDRASWEALRPRLDPDADGRFPTDWPIRVAALHDTDYPVTTMRSHLDGFFGYLRELCGDEIYYLFYDDPGLVREMLDFQVRRIGSLLRRITRDVHIDRQYIWEDMCYKTGPLIGPDLFRGFLLEPYCRLVEISRECGVEIIDVDSDGNVSELIPLWLEAGVTMLHPMEVAAGMDVVTVARAYGERLIIRGGIDKREVAKGRREIDREMERVRPALETGSYIPHMDHSVPPDVSWDNYRYYLDRRRDLVLRCS